MRELNMMLETDREIFDVPDHTGKPEE